MSELTQQQIESALVAIWHQYGGMPAVETGLVNMPALMAGKIMELYAAQQPAPTPEAPQIYLQGVNPAPYQRGDFNLAYQRFNEVLWSDVNDPISALAAAFEVLLIQQYVKAHPPEDKYLEQLSRNLNPAYWSWHDKHYMADHAPDQARRQHYIDQARRAYDWLVTPTDL